MPAYTYTCDSCDEADQLHVHGMTVDPFIGCSRGHRMRRKVGRVNFRFRLTQSPHYQDYREDLARFKGDPEAYVNSDYQVNKLRDKRLRQGWVEGPPIDECHYNEGDDDPNTIKIEDDPTAVHRAYERAKANNFKLEGEE